MQIHLLSLLVFVVGANIVDGADSDGKEFVFNFMQTDEYDISSVTTTNVIVIPLHKDSICSFQYTQTSDHKVVSISRSAFFGKTNEIIFDPNEVLLQPTWEVHDISMMPDKDFRIYVSCSEDVTLIAKYEDAYHAQGDIFLIPSISNAGNKYILSMPTGYDPVKGWITILPITKQLPFTVNVEGYVNGVLFSNQSRTYDSKIGDEQLYITVNPLNQDDYKATLKISGTSNFFITYLNPWAVSGSLQDGSCGISCNWDYITFMPMPVVGKECNKMLALPDQRIITNDFTTRLYVSPPNVPHNCNEMFKIQVYDKFDNVTGNCEIISDIGSSTISLTDKSEMGSETFEGETVMYRFGSFHHSPDNLTGYGHFAHYVPSVQEWVTGQTQFYTLAKDCSAELYTDQVNPDSIKLDGITLTKPKYTLNYMDYFNKKFGHFIVPISGYGVHSIDSGSNYVLYVVCKNVHSIYNGAGYLASFNQAKNQ
uniref:IgGFc_binding domain-containing protein n=1 Tax=Rhabditophanes sp. KR3021 TaxID=114890 RepID=A0AC35UAK4_9BILA